VRQKVKNHFLPGKLGFEGKASFAFKPCKPNENQRGFRVSLPPWQRVESADLSQKPKA
jgi:hypothetical protein